MKSRSGIKVEIIFIIMGLAFVGIWFLLNKLDENKMENLDSTTYSIETNYKIRRDSDSTMYTPQYTYIVKGKKYVCTSNFSSSIKPSNESKKIFYNSKNPHECFPEKGTPEKIFSIMFLGIPILFILIGLSSLFGLLQFKEKYKEPTEERNTIINRKPW